MPTTEHVDVLVIGSGEAGKYLAWTLSKDGHRTALVERTLVGGSCPNVACLPSKNVIHAAKVASRLVPYCMFTDPVLARVGLNESEANARGMAYRLATLPMAAVLRTRTISEARGLRMTALLANVR